MLQNYWMTFSRSFFLNCCLKTIELLTIHLVDDASSVRAKPFFSVLDVDVKRPFFATNLV